MTLQIADCRLQIGIADCRLAIADCRLAIADCRLAIADWIRIADHRQAKGQSTISNQSAICNLQSAIQES
jgi:hypothetical protein